MTDPVLRASDEDRQRVVAVLQRHTAAGRLSLDEFSERARNVYAATTFAELSVITRDLPVEPAHRQLLAAFLLAAITIAILAILLALGR